MNGSQGSARLSDRDRSRLAELLADAFDDDPMQRWLFPNPGRRRRQLVRFYERDLRYRLEGRCIIDVDATLGVAFWHPPGDQATVPVRAALHLATSFVDVAFQHPVAALRTLTEVARARPAEPHWYLSHLAVAPGAQGNGIGGRLLDGGIRRAERDAVGVYLETANSANLPFYTAHGFAEVRTVARLPAPPVWLLWRPASSAGDLSS